MFILWNAMVILTMMSSEASVGVYAEGFGDGEGRQTDPMAASHRIGNPAVNAVYRISTIGVSTDNRIKASRKTEFKMALIF